MPFFKWLLGNKGFRKLVRKIRKIHFKILKSYKIYVKTLKIYVKYFEEIADIIGEMFISSLTGKTIEMAKNGLDAAALRNDVISNNIANVNTPGFKRQSVLFEQSLNESKISAKRTEPKHIPFSYEKSGHIPRIITESDTITRNDENNVDIDKEMADLSKNTIYYNAIATRLARKFSLLKLAAQGGK